MTQKEKIDFILEIMPNVSRILNFATEDQIDKLVDLAKQKFDFELTEASFV